MTNEHDAHLLSGAYALDALTPEEAAAVEAAMAESEELRGEVVGLVDTAVALGLAVPAVAPPPALRARLLAAIEETPQEAAVPQQETAPPTLPQIQEQPAPVLAGQHVASRRRRLRRPAVLLAAAGLAVLLFTGGLLVGQAVLRPQTEYSQLEAAADVERATARVAGGGTATVSWSDSQDRTAVVLNGVSAPSGRVLQLWSLRGEDITSEGLYEPQGDARYTVLEGAPAAGEQLAVSVEPAGGSDQPTTTPIVVVPLDA